MMTRNFLFNGRGAALLGAAFLGALSVLAALGVAPPWWAAAGLAVLAAGAACAPGPRAAPAPAAPPPRAEPRSATDALADTLRRAAEGDLGARVTPLPDAQNARALALDINRLLDTTDAFMRQGADVIDHLGRGKAPPRLPVHSFQGDFARLASKLNHAALTSSQRLDGFRRLTARFEQRVITAAEAMSASAEGLEASAGGVGQIIARAQSGARGIAETAREARGAVAGAAETARAVAPPTADPDPEPIRRAVAETRQAATAVAALSGAAARIKDVMRRIKRVSDFSRMLSVNASVEAARAGEAGKGFAVVAAEVQTLADQSAAAAREARDEISAVDAGIATATAAIIAAIAAIDGLASAAAAGEADAQTRRDALRSLMSGLEHAALRSTAAAAAAEAAPDAANDTGRAAEDLSSAARKLNEHAADLRLELEGYLADASAA